VATGQWDQLSVPVSPDGSFRFTGLRSGTYTFVALADGFCQTNEVTAPITNGRIADLSGRPLILGRCETLHRDMLPPSCLAPQFPQPAPTKIDSVCGAVGSGGEDANQNQAKNNFCATGPTKPITIPDMMALQKRAQATKGVTFGNSDRHPLTSGPGPVIDRRPLVALGEGNLVTLQGYVLIARQEGSESVNCGKKVPNTPAYHDIHISIVDAATNTDECSGVVVEMTPHHRPASWTQENIQSVTAKHLLVRVTGQLMFDSSHTPCASGVAVQGDPRRASLWEVHPIYKFEVCPLSTCAEFGWITLEDWVRAGAN
jgi:hypothetical protein